MRTTYHPVAKGLHWLMAVAIIGLLSVGLIMKDLPLSPEKLQLYSWHKWAGVSVFALVWVRLLLRLIHPAPALPATMAKPLQLAAHAGHALLYGLMIVIPLSGWLMSSAKGVQTVWFGLWPIPDLLGKDKALGETLAQVHGLLNDLLMVVLLGHAGAALKHHFIDRDDILRRMLPSRRPSLEKDPL
jgi:cytochrome b561